MHEITNIMEALDEIMEANAKETLAHSFNRALISGRSEQMRHNFMLLCQGPQELLRLFPALPSLQM